MDYNPAMRALQVLLLVVAMPAAAAGAPPRGGGPGEVPRAVSLAEGLSLEQAVKRAEKRYKARAVRADERNEGGRRVYHIRLLGEDGRVFEITVDASTGRTE